MQPSEDNLAHESANSGRDQTLKSMAFDLSGVGTGKWKNFDKITETAERARGVLDTIVPEHSDMRFIRVNSDAIWRVIRTNGKGFIVDKFQQRRDNDNWPVDIHIGGFILRPNGELSQKAVGDMATADVPLPLRPATMTSLRRINKYIDEIKKAHKLEVETPRLVQFSTHGLISLKQEELFGKAPDTGGQTEYVDKIGRAMGALGGRAVTLNRGGFLVSTKDDEATLPPHSGMEFTDDLSMGVIRIEDGEVPDFVRKEDLYELLDSLSIDAARHLYNEFDKFIMAHYCDGMYVAAKCREILQADDSCIAWVPHSLGWHKAKNVVMGDLGSCKKQQEAGEVEGEAAMKLEQRIELLSELAPRVEMTAVAAASSLERDSLLGELDKAFPDLNLGKRIRMEQELFDQEVDYAVSTSSEIRQIMCEVYGYPDERIVDLAPGYDEKAFRPENRPIAKNPEWDEFYQEIADRTGQDRHFLEQHAVFVSEFSRTASEKDKFSLVRAMAELKKRDPMSKVVLTSNIAKNDVGNEIRAFIDETEDLHYNVAAFGGNVSDDTLQRSMATATIYATMSKQEGFGMSLLNGAGAGKLCIFTPAVPFGVEYLLGDESQREVVTTELGGEQCQFTVGKAGIMVDLGDYKSLAAAIEWTLNLDHEDRVLEMRDQAADIARSSFTWKALVRNCCKQLGVQFEDGELRKHSFDSLTRRFSS